MPAADLGEPVILLLLALILLVAVLFAGRGARSGSPRQRRMLLVIAGIVLGVAVAWVVVIAIQASGA